MRKTPLVLFLLAVCPVVGYSEGLTILMEFDSPVAPKALIEMKKESETVLKNTGLQLAWTLRQDYDSSNSASDLVIVKFKGHCAMENYPQLLDERGPLAWTYSSDGEMLPYSEVSCDKVRNSIRKAMHGGDYAKGDKLMGRAVGRVLAHELVHILSNSKEHGKEGVAKTALSPANLIAESMKLHEADALRISKNIK
jgi:hypothetical protein